MNENLLTSVKNMITPDFVNQASTILGETTGQTKAGLFAAIPTLISGVIAKASTAAGANDLIQTVKTEGFDAGVPAVPTSVSVDKGQSLLASIFGDRASGVVDQFSTGTGMSPSFASKVLGIAAPLVMSVIGAKAKSQGFSPSALMGFLSDQRVATPVLDTNTLQSGVTQVPTYVPPETKSRVGRYIGYAALILVAVWFFFGRHHRQTDVVSTNLSSPMRSWRAGDDQKMVSDSDMMSDFESVIRKDSTVDLPRRYSFTAITFDTGSSELTPAAKDSIRQIARAILSNPNSKVRIEGNTDNTGASARNRALAKARAQAVRQQFAYEGVPTGQFAMSAKGESTPVDTNTNARGRRNNRRIDFVIIQR